MFGGKVSTTTVIVVAIFTTVPMLYSIYHTPKIKTAKPFQKCHAATPCDIPFKVTVGPTTFKNPTEAEAGCKAAGFDRLCDKAAVKSANQNQCGAGWTSDGAGWWRRDESPGDACGRAQQLGGPSCSTLLPQDPTAQCFRIAVVQMASNFNKWRCAVPSWDSDI